MNLSWEMSTHLPRSAGRTNGLAKKGCIVGYTNRTTGALLDITLPVS